MHLYISSLSHHQLAGVWVFVEGRVSRVICQGSRVIFRGSRVKSRVSRVKSRGSRVKGRGSRVKSRGLRVKCRGSRVKSRRSPKKSRVFLKVRVLFNRSVGLSFPKANFLFLVATIVKKLSL